MITRFTVALLTLTISLCMLQATAGAVAVKLVPATQAVAAGNTVRVEVVVEDVFELGAYQLTLQFVPQAMSVSQVTEGEFLKAQGTTLGAGLENIDNTAGRVTFFYSLTTRGASVTGSGALAAVTFNSATTASGTFELLLSDILLVNGTGTTLSVEAVANGTCTLTQAEQPAPTASPSSGSGSGGGSGNVPTSTPLPTLTPGESLPTSTPGEPLPASTPGEPSPSTVSGTPTVTGAGSTTTPATNTGSETSPGTVGSPGTRIPGFTASGAAGCILLAVAAYALRLYRRSKQHEE